MLNPLPELDELEKLLEKLSGVARIETLAKIPCRSTEYPVYGISMGSTRPEAPALGFFGGVHGLERIGTKVILAFLQTFAELTTWDRVTKSVLEHCRIVLIPLINPAGMSLSLRSNANGVDLMRNAPVEAEGLHRFFLPGGHRISNRLPWYRGPAGHPMETEATAVCEFVRREIFPSSVAITLDVHSGYGTVDRIWFPYARTKKPFPQLAEVFALKAIFDRSFPNHVYRIEPQAHQYTTHGDLWDFLYDEHHRDFPNRLFLPLSLEMGSWAWVKKNPKQLLSILGAFNPLLPHRRSRTLRRHLTFFDFLQRVVHSSEGWASLSSTTKSQYNAEAMELWYGKAA